MEDFITQVDDATSILTFQCGNFLDITEIFIRSQYEEIFKIMLGTKKAKRDSPKFLVLGNPGIGKTYFLFYLCYKLAQLGNRVIYKARMVGNSPKFVMIYNNKVFDAICLVHSDKSRLERFLK
jgi:hypothetical protein